MSNHRFVNKGLLHADPKILAAVIDYFEHGGTVTVCKSGRRSHKNISFPMRRGSISDSGHKAVILRNQSYSSRVRG